MKAELKTTALKAALPFAATERTRYAFDAVRVTEDGAILATDGKAAIRVRPADTEPPRDATPSALLPRFRLEQLAKAATGDAIEIETEGTTYTARLETKLSSATTAPGDISQGSFPALDRLFDREYTGEIRFNARVLESLLKAAKIYGKSQDMTLITLRTAGKDQAAGFEISNADGDTVEGLIMPVSE